MENIVNQNSEEERVFCSVLACAKYWSKISLPIVILKSETQKELDVKTQLSNSK